jgi:hypothetical protein
MAGPRPQPDALIAATCFITLPAPAQAHGLSAEAATFIFALVALALVVPALADHFVITRRLGDRSSLAAILDNLIATAAAIPLFLVLQWLSGAAATAFELGSVRAAYWLRTLSPWPEIVVTIAAMAVMKAEILSWRSGEPLSGLIIGLLFVSTAAGMCVAAAVAALFVYATG